MEQNIYRVIDESQIDEILEEHKQILVVMMYSSKNCGPCKAFKPKFVNLAVQHRDVLFVYVDKTQFTITKNKYFKDYNLTPTFIYFFGGNNIAFVEGVHEAAIIKTLMTIKEKIEEKRQDMIKREKLLEAQKENELQEVQINFPPEQNNNDTIMMHKKVELLGKLRELEQYGVKMSKHYTLDSDYNDMLFEYEYHINHQYKQLNQPDQQNKKQEQVKQEQVKQLQELGMLHQRMQMQNLQKLQSLKKIQQMKEQQEKNEQREER